MDKQHSFQWMLDMIQRLIGSRRDNMQAENNSFEIIKNLLKNQKVAGQEYCEKHNETYDLIETPGGIVGSCSICWREGIKKEDKAMAEIAIESKGAWQTPFIMKNEHVSDDLKDAKLNTYKPTDKTQEQAKKLAIQYIKQFNGERSLIISGGSGRGKSHIGISIANAIRQMGYTAWFVKSRDILKLIQSTYEDGSALTEDYIMKVIETIDLLVLDDLGAEYIKPIQGDSESWASDILYNVFELRLNKATVCTTNYSMSALEQKYSRNGERINSRLLYKADTIRLQGEDYRLTI